MQPSTQSFAPRQFAGRRVASPSGDGQPVAQGLSTPHPQQLSQPQSVQRSATSHPPAPQTFAQMQATGQARPNPPSASSAPGGYVNASGDRTGPDYANTVQPTDSPADVQGKLDRNAQQQGMVQDPVTHAWVDPSSQEYQWHTGAIPTGPTVYQGRYDANGHPRTTQTMVNGVGTGQVPDNSYFSPGGSLPPATDPHGPGSSTFPSGPAGSSGLEQAIQQALSTPSRYDASAYQQMRDASMQALRSQFGADQQSLDEEMARRGLGASTIGSQYQTNLKGQQDTAISQMDASLLKDAADNFNADRSTNLSSGLQLLGLNQNSDQFSRNLAQQLGIATMQDKTANRGVDANASLANNDLMLRVLAALGLPAGSLAGGSTGTKPTGTTGSTPTGGTPTGGAPSGPPADPNAPTNGGQPVQNRSSWYWDENGQLRRAA